MKRIFRPKKFITAPDGTQVSAFLNATDSTASDIPPGVAGEVSIAAGRIGPGVRSWIHAHPAVTQVTYVLSGAVSVKMKDPRQPAPYLLEVPQGSAVVSEPGTLLQLRNETDEPAQVLYIVSPSYVLEAGEDDAARYDDSVLVAEDWGDLEPADWDAYASKAARRTALKRRASALKRLTSRRKAGEA